MGLGRASRKWRCNEAGVAAPGPCLSGVPSLGPRVETGGEGAGSPARSPAQLPEVWQLSVCWADVETLRLIPRCLAAWAMHTAFGSWARGCHHLAPFLSTACGVNKHPRGSSSKFKHPSTGSFIHSGYDLPISLIIRYHLGWHGCHRI